MSAALSPESVARLLSQPSPDLRVELAEGLVVLGQVADGFGVKDLKVGAAVELVVETLYSDEQGERTIWRWKPVNEGISA